MSFSCLIVDDEQHAIDILSRYVAKTPELALAGTERNPMKALATIETKANVPDIAFLDISMPQLSGIELADLICQDTEIIFTTAYRQYAVEAFEENAIDYLLKPITYYRFLKAINRAKEKFSVKHAKLLEKVPSEVSLRDDHFFIKGKVKGQIIKVPYIRISYIEACLNYLKIYLDKKTETYSVYLTMKEMEKYLSGKGFMRVHHSFIINLQKIKLAQGHVIILDDNSTVSIGETYRKNFLQFINPRLIISKRKF